MSLLPPNATLLERGIEAASSRIGAVPLPFGPLWDPETCPLDLLPYLAFALSIDSWSPDWPEATKRARVRQAIDIQRHKGTAKSIRDIIAVFGGRIALREWWQTVPHGVPHTFNLILSVTGADGGAPSGALIEQIIDEITRTKPVRSHFTFSQAFTVIGGLRPVGTVRAGLFNRIVMQTPLVPVQALRDRAGQLIADRSPAVIAVRA